MTDDELKNSLRAELDRDLDQRITRMKVSKPHFAIPGTYFSGASAECSDVFRDGNFYSAISLSQAVLERLAKFILEKNSLKPKKVYELNIALLSKHGIIGDELRARLIYVWENRDNYHHLNPEIKSDYHELWELAEKTVVVLVDLEKHVFAFDIDNGKLVPKNLQYWDIEDGLATVFIRGGWRQASNP